MSERIQLLQSLSDLLGKSASAERNQQYYDQLDKMISQTKQVIGTDTQFQTLVRTIWTPQLSVEKPGHDVLKYTWEESENLTWTDYIASLIAIEMALILNPSVAFVTQLVLDWVEKVQAEFDWSIEEIKLNTFYFLPYVPNVRNVLLKMTL